MLMSNVQTATKPSPTVIERRAHKRRDYDAPCFLRKGQRMISAVALDLSEGGACLKLRGLGAVSTGDAIAIHFEGCPPINAIARWTKDRRIGMQFTETLDEHAQIAVVLARLEAACESGPVNEADEAETPSKLH